MQILNKKIQEYLMNKDPGPNLSTPTADTSLHNLKRQGFSTDDTSDNPWHQKGDYILRNKVTFDIHQTNPQVDIQPLGYCEDWVHKVCLMDHTDQNTQPHEQESQPISYSTILAACVYGADGKYKGMLTPKRLRIVHQKYNEVKRTGLHDVSPPPQSFASELVGLFVRKARATKQFDGKEIKDSFHRILPPHVIATFKHCTAVTQERIASPLDFNPDLPHYWSSHPHDTILGAFTDYFSSSFSGFSICHPINDDDIMHLA